MSTKKLTPASFFAQAAHCIALFNSWVETKNMLARADHICYRCDSVTEYKRLRGLLEKSAQFVYQSMISGRRIAIIKFAPALETALGPISVLELSDQKPNRSQVSGFDHIEIYPAVGSVDRLAESLSVQRVNLDMVVRPHHTTYDAKIGPDFKVRLEAEPLLEKIAREELLK